MNFATPDDLIAAVEGGFIERVRNLLAASNGAPIITPKALRLACEDGRTDILRLLVESGANIHGDMEKCLAAAVESDHVETTAYLLSLIEKPLSRPLTDTATSGSIIDMLTLVADTIILDRGDEALAYLTGYLKNDPAARYPLVTHYVVMLAQLQGKPKEKWGKILFEDGGPGDTLLRLAGAGLLNEMFAPADWLGREPAARALFHRIEKTLPPVYRSRVLAVDMTAFRLEPSWTTLVTPPEKETLPDAPAR